jgi:hypothetical protein
LFKHGPVVLEDSELSGEPPGGRAPGELPEVSVEVRARSNRITRAACFGVRPISVRNRADR